MICAKNDVQPKNWKKNQKIFFGVFKVFFLDLKTYIFICKRDMS